MCAKPAAQCVTLSCTALRRGLDAQGDKGVQPVLKQVWAAASQAVDRLVDIAEDYAPEGVSRGAARHRCSSLWPLDGWGAALCMSSRLVATYPTPGECGRGDSCEPSVQVSLGVRAALVLLLVGFARSLLGVWALLLSLHPCACVILRALNNTAKHCARTVSLDRA